MVKLTPELRKSFDDARKDLAAAGWDQVCSVMDDGNKSGRIDFGTLYIRPMAKPMPKCEETHRKFWLNYKTVGNVALFIDIAATLDTDPEADLSTILARHTVV